MKRALILFAFIALPLLARPITDKDLFRFVWIADPQMAPDGSRVAFVRVTVNAKKDGYDTAIWSVPVRGGESPQRITNGPHDTMPRWPADGKQLAFLRATEKEGKPQPPQIHLLSMSGGEPHAITSIAKGASAMAWSPNGQTIAFTSDTTAEDREKKDEDVYESDVRIINQAAYRQNGQGYNDPTRKSHVWTIRPFDEKAQPKQITSGEFDEESPVWSSDGSRIYFVSNRVRESYYGLDRNALYAVPADGGDMTRVAAIDGGISRVSPSPDGKWIVFRGEITKPARSYNQPDLFVVSTAAGSTPRNLTAAYDYDVFSGPGGDQRAPRGSAASQALWTKDGHGVILNSAERGASNLIRVDLDSGRVTPVTAGNHDVQAWTNNVILMSTPAIIGDLYRVDNNGQLVRLTDVNKTLFDELTLTEPDELMYPSFDGRQVEAWIQKPPEYQSGKRYPLILNIHGGPHSAYGYTFDHEFQWMAAKGYVVLYPNPRGSTTYGQEFGNIIQYRYPGDDYKDLMAGVDEVIKRGLADPKKLGVTGGSGGGLLTNWTITQTDRFAAAVSQRSIADWSNFWYTADFTLFNPTWFHKSPFEDRADFEARSPITYIERVHTPLMLIEGEADYRTPPASGGEMMFRALKYLHRPAVMIRFPDESHELSRSGKPWHRVERLEHIVNWFDKYLQNKPMTIYDVALAAP